MGSAAAPLPLAVAKIAVAQICSAAGYDAAEAAALRALADIATRFLAAAGHAAASITNSRCRSESNLIDLVIAIEQISLPRGFPGAGQPGAPPLTSSSGPLKGIMDFVASVNEIPFARPIQRWREKGEIRNPWSTFAQLRVDPPSPYIPRWLPKFPDNWDRRQARRSRKRMVFGWNSEKNELEEIPSPAPGVSSTAKRPLPVDRKRVKFAICHRFGSKISAIEEEIGKKKLKIAPPSPSRMTPVLMGSHLWKPLPSLVRWRS